MAVRFAWPSSTRDPVTTGEYGAEAPLAHLGANTKATHLTSVDIPQCFTLPSATLLNEMPEPLRGSKATRVGGHEGCEMASTRVLNERGANTNPTDSAGGDTSSQVLPIHPLVRQHRSCINQGRRFSVYWRIEPRPRCAPNVRGLFELEGRCCTKQDVIKG